jgi:ubiquinone/menaquinone biosynthesis C-methylase UbiE
MKKKEDLAQGEKIRQAVRDGYSEIAQKGKGSCCGNSKPTEFAQAIGYCQEELETLPEGANMGLSCGNPTAIANLKPGQVVLDLGSGGGFDVFIAAKKVGLKGRAIGVDMTPEMLSKARSAITKFTEKTGLNNVEFRLGEIEHLPVADNSIDVVISNCVINLSPQKEQVWREISRVLKAGGNVCVSDLALKEELPEQVKAAAEALVGCISGAIPIDDTLKMMHSASLTDIEAKEKPFNFDVMDNCNDTFYKTIRDKLPSGKRLSDYVASVDFTAYKKG